MNSLFSFCGFKSQMLILLLCFIVAQSKVEANVIQVDSLRYDEEFYKLRTKLTRLVFVHPDSALICAQAAEKSSKKEIQGLCFHVKGVVAANRGNYKKSLDYNFKAQKVFSDLKDEHYINILNLNIGFCYTKLAYYTLATEYLFKARNYFDKTYEIVVKNRVYLVLTELFVALKEHEKAKEYALSSQNFSYEAKDTFGLTTSYNDIALIYFRENDHINARKFYKKALKLSLAAQLNRSLTYSQHGLGEIYLLSNDLDSANYYFNKVLSNKETDELTKIKCLRNYAMLDIKRKKFEEAEKKAKKSLLLSKNSKISIQSFENYQFLGELYALTKDFEKAYIYRDSSAIMNDSIYEENKIRQAAEFEEIYQNKKKQERIDALALENELQKTKYQKTQNFVIGLVVSLVLLLVSGLFIFRYNKLKAVYKNSELEQKLLRSQMNPHFIFNAISSIQSFIVKNNADEAGLYLSNFAKLMRHILINSKQEFISLEDEIDTLKNYLKLQQLRLNNNFDFSINIPDEIDEEELAIPPMIIQPFIENAIKHGLSKMETGGLITIDIAIDNNKLKFEVADNGIGRSEAEKFREDGHKSLATEITTDRLKHLRKKFRKNTEIKIVDLHDDNSLAKGTKVIVKLPLRYLD
jgi:hypothetical protein